MTEPKVLEGRHYCRGCDSETHCLKCHIPDPAYKDGGFNSMPAVEACACTICNRVKDGPHE